MLARLLQLSAYYSFNRPRKGLNIINSAFQTLPFLFPSNRTADSPLPRSFNIRVTSHCNLRCVQCGQWGEEGCFDLHKEMADCPELSTKEWISFFDQYASNISHIYFWGGEPLLKEGFAEMVECATRHGIVSEISTNGTLLQKAAEALVNAELDYAGISLDGPEEVNNRIRIGKGNVFGRAMNGLSMLLACREKRRLAVPIIEITMTLIEENQHHIYDTYKVALESGADVFHLQFPTFTSRYLESLASAEYRADFGKEPFFWKGFIREFDKIDHLAIDGQIDDIRRDVKRHKRIVFRQTPSFAFSTEEYFKYPETPLTAVPCTFPWDIMQIMPDGSMTMCADFPDLVGGNIRNQNWKVIWNGDKFCSFRKRILNDGVFPACSRCCNRFCDRSRLHFFGRLLWE